MKPTVYLIDGSGYIFRAYYAVRPLSTRAGVPTNAVVGFARMLGKLIRDKQPAFLGIAFDTPEKNFRHAMYPEYKANRDAPPEDLLPQFGLIRELVSVLDIPVLDAPGFEADDVLATLSAQAVAAGYAVTLVSADKDLMQLVAPAVGMFDPMKDRYYARDGVIERFGVPPELVGDVLALAGDASDNIPGVPKVGEKSAAKLVSQYGDVEAIVRALCAKNATELKAVERSVIEHVESARLSKRLATLSYEAPLTLDFEKLKYTKPEEARLGPFLRRIEAVGLLRELGYDTQAPTPTSSAPEVAKEPPSLDHPSIDRTRYQTIFALDVLRQLLDEARAAKRLSIDLETTSIDPNQADIVGVALAVQNQAPAYVPIAHRYLGVPKQLPLAAVLELLRPILEETLVLKVGQNLKYDSVVLARAGVVVRGIGDDSILLAYVLDPTRASFSLDALAREILGHENIRYADVTGTGKSQIGFDAVPIEQATAYAAEDADVALRLCDALAPNVKQAGLDQLYRDVELPLVSVLAAMEATGIKVDKACLQGLGQEFNSRLLAIEAKAHALAGRAVNLASPKQLADLFFNEMGLPPVKKTKTGYSTDQDVLEVLARDHELPRVVLEHRLLAKLKSTYVEMLPRMINARTGRVHTSFNQTGTATGRLSSTDPNLQNIPARSDDGRRIRAAFIPEANHKLISADYSQIELRVMAHLSQDERFIQAFLDGEDIHARTAQEILTGGLPPDPEMRRRAKAINFGILYGLSEFGLSKQLDISRAEANAYIKAYFARYPGIRVFLDATIEHGRERGFVTTYLGRRRFLPELKSQNGNLRQAAERIAMNTPIQGSAADLIKLAMLGVDRALRAGKFRSRMLLQVHDELVVEAPNEEVDAVCVLLRQEMSGVAKLRVPLDVDVGVGSNWAEAH